MQVILRMREASFITKIAISGCTFLWCVFVRLVFFLDDIREPCCLYAFQDSIDPNCSRLRRPVSWIPIMDTVDTYPDDSGESGKERSGSKCKVCINTLRPTQNGRYSPDEIFGCIFMYENVWISIKISLKFVPGGPINKFPSLVQKMACRLIGSKPLSEPMTVRLPTHMSVVWL